MNDPIVESIKPCMLDALAITPVFVDGQVVQIKITTKGIDGVMTVMHPKAAAELRDALILALPPPKDRDFDLDTMSGLRDALSEVERLTMELATMRVTEKSVNEALNRAGFVAALTFAEAIDQLAAYREEYNGLVMRIGTADSAVAVISKQRDALHAEVDLLRRTVADADREAHAAGALSSMTLAARVKMLGDELKQERELTKTLRGQIDRDDNDGVHFLSTDREYFIRCDGRTPTGRHRTTNDQDVTCIRCMRALLSDAVRIINNAGAALTDAQVSCNTGDIVVRIKKLITDRDEWTRNANAARADQKGAEIDANMSNRTDWIELAAEIVHAHVMPSTLRKRIAVEMHKAYIAGREESPEVPRFVPTNKVD